MSMFENSTQPTTYRGVRVPQKIVDAMARIRKYNEQTANKLPKRK